MPKLRNPDTGETVSATAAGAKVLLGRGYLAIGATAAPDDTAKPLEQMKLAELLDQAERSGADEATLDELRKPGTSKAQVIAVITAASS
jgi:hypothetical protein